MEEYFTNTKILSGPGSVKALRELGSKALFMVADPYFEKNGTARRLAELSGAERTQIFSQITPDPTLEQVAQATVTVQEFKPDTVVALGGGSAMDCAKAMVYFSGLPVTFVAIPTTSGSGSEVTDFAVLTQGGVKHPLVDEKLCPQIAILDGELLGQLPKTLIADAGFDVLAHALEAYVAAGAGAITDALAKEAFCTAVTQLPLSYTGVIAARQKMHEAATMAGMAFTRAGLGLCHAMSHALGGLLHLPHGRLNAILLPAVIGTNSGAVQAKYAVMARSAGFAGSADTVAVRNLKNGLIRLRKELQLPATLAEAGVQPGKVWQSAGKIAEAVLADPCCKSNPVQVEDYMIRRILEEVTGRV